MSTFNERIKNRRKELGLTQKELADMLSISDKTVSRWESSNQIPDSMLIPDLASALQMSLDELYGIEKNESKQSTDECNSTLYQSTEKRWILRFYKIAMSISLFITMVGSYFLYRADFNFSDYFFTKAGTKVFSIGCMLLVTTEIAYNVIYRREKECRKQYFKNDILFSGVAIFIISFFVLSVFPLNDTVELYSDFIYKSLYIIALFLALLLWHKYTLKRQGAILSKKTTIIPIVFVVASFITIALIDNYFYQHFDESALNYNVLKQLKFHRISHDLFDYINPLHFMVLNYSRRVITLIAYAVLCTNYIELLKKSDIIKQKVFNNNACRKMRFSLLIAPVITIILEALPISMTRNYTILDSNWQEQFVSDTHSYFDFKNYYTLDFNFSVNGITGYVPLFTAIVSCLVLIALTIYYIKPKKCLVNIVFILLFIGILSSMAIWAATTICPFNIPQIISLLMIIEFALLYVYHSYSKITQNKSECFLFLCNLWNYYATVIV